MFIFNLYDDTGLNVNDGCFVDVTIVKVSRISIPCWETRDDRIWINPDVGAWLDGTLHSRSSISCFLPWTVADGVSNFYAVAWIMSRLMRACRPAVKGSVGMLKLYAHEEQRKGRV